MIKNSRFAFLENIFEVIFVQKHLTTFEVKTCMESLKKLGEHSNNKIVVMPTFSTNKTCLVDKP